ncbi:MAG: Lactate-binding periplasmic protein precursor [Syntrophorhabdus sp. PtaU1.Bin153]|nr:MAG: Lactate-binding periplasmic protein precursor [Syntrophorhabdus sp. PtaU1.Bin153]
MKKICAVTSIIAIATVVLFATSYPVYSKEKVIRLRYSNFHPPVHAIGKLSEEWCREVEKRTNGRVKIQYYPGSTLTPPMQTYDSVAKGIADIGESLVAYAPGRLPLSEVLMLPLGYANGYQATKLANEFFKKFRPKEFDDVKMMFMHGGDHTRICTTKPTTSIKSIKGLRLITNSQAAKIVSAVGGAPVTIPVTESYDSLQRGMCDGFFMMLESLKGFKLCEVTKYCLDNPAVSYNAAIFIVMNKNKWNLISQKDREIIEKINEEWIEKQGKLWNRVIKESIEYAKQHGVKFVNVSQQEIEETSAAMKPVINDYISAMKAKGLPGKEAVDFCLDYLKKHPESGE